MEKIKSTYRNRIDKGFKIMALSVLFLAMIACNKKPISKFSFSPTNIYPGDTVYFNASASNDPDGSIIDYSWDFNDSQKGKGREINHPFSNSGDYVVKLTVKDNKGKKGKTEDELIVKPENVLSLVPDTIDAIIFPDSINFFVVASSKRELFELFVPPGSVKEPTEIRIIANSKRWNNNEMIRTASTILEVMPDNLVLEKPATIRIIYPEKITEFNKVRIFNKSQDNNFEISPFQIVTDTLITALMYHFSSYSVGTPSQSVIEDLSAGLNSNSDATISSASSSQPESELFDNVSEAETTMGQVNELASLYEELGLSSTAASLRQGNVNMAKRIATEILSQPLPANPCGKYMNDYLRYGKLLSRYIPRDMLMNQIRDKGEEILDECPIIAKISYKLFSVPTAINGGLRSPIEISNNATPKFTGGGLGDFWIGGPGLTMEGANMKIICSGKVNNTADGFIDIEPPFDVKLNITMIMETIDLYLEVIISTEGQTFTVFTGAVDMNTVFVAVASPLGVITGSSENKPYTKHFVFDLIDGAKFIEEKYDQDGFGFHQIWLLEIEGLK